MKHLNSYDVSTATNVLSLDPVEIPLFVRRCVKDRSLSFVVTELNKALLSGTADEREEAHGALRHLGFI